MADAVIQTPRRSSATAPVSHGPMGKLLFGILQFGGWLVLGLFGNIIMEWLCMGLLWPDEGPSRSQKLRKLKSSIFNKIYKIAS